MNLRVAVWLPFDGTSSAWRKHRRGASYRKPRPDGFACLCTPINSKQPSPQLVNTSATIHTALAKQPPARSWTLAEYLEQGSPLCVRNCPSRLEKPTSGYRGLLC